MCLSLVLLELQLLRSQSVPQVQSQSLPPLQVPEEQVVPQAAPRPVESRLQLLAAQPPLGTQPALGSQPPLGSQWAEPLWLPLGSLQWILRPLQ